MKAKTKKARADYAKPPAPYQGGKRITAKAIVEKINRIPHRAYVEPFCGLGGVFFRRDKVSRTEIINDLSGEVINFFRILQRHYPQLIDCLKFQVPSRREFDHLKARDAASMTDLERAVRFLYLQTLCFGGTPLADKILE